MTSIYDNYGERAREKLKEEFNRKYIERDLECATRDIKDITTFIAAAKDQIAVIEKTAFKQYIEFRKGKDYYANKIEFSISVFSVPQVPGNEQLKVYSTDDSRRWVGNDKKKEAVDFTLAVIKKYPAAELIGTGKEIILKAQEKLKEIVI